MQCPPGGSRTGDKQNSYQKGIKMNTELPTSEVLNRAADLIEEHGWAKGGRGWSAETPGLCLEGGILAALGTTYVEVNLRHFYSCSSYRAVEAYLGRSAALTEDGAIEQGLWAWNDDQESAERVIATLRAVALIEAAKERPANLVVFDAPTLAEAVSA